MALRLQFNRVGYAARFDGVLNLVKDINAVFLASFGVFLECKDDFF